MKLAPDSGETSKSKKKTNTDSKSGTVEMTNNIDVDVLSNTVVDSERPAKKKRKHDTYDQNVPSDMSNNQNVPSLDVVNVGHKKPHKRRKMESAAERQVTVNGHVAVNPVHRLLDNMSRVLQESHSKRKENYKTTENHFEWQKVCFDNNGPEECKAMWDTVCKQMRKFRTLAELVDEAKSKTLKDPRKPKPPASPLFRFHKKKRASIARKHPNLRNGDLMKLLTKKYEKLSESKKQKYVDAYTKAKILYDEEMAKYRAEKMLSSDRPMSAWKYFVYKKCSKKSASTLPQKEQAKLKTKYRKRWLEMEPEKKVKFIKEALTASEEYKTRIKSEPSCKVKFVPRIKLLRDEQQLIKSYEHPPSRQRVTSFSMFYDKFSRQCQESEISFSLKIAYETWYNLSSKKKAHYAKKAAKVRSQLQEQHAIEVVTNKILFKGAPTKFRSACAYFFHETLPTLSSSMNRKARIAECRKQWNELSTLDQDLWKVKLADAKRVYLQELENIPTEEQSGQTEVTLEDKTIIEEKKDASPALVDKRKKAKKNKV